MTPTPEQEAILALAKDPQSLLINALAGAAKTTTLCLLAAKLPLVPTACVAFNKRIAVEMQKRLPSHIQSSTLNSLGHRVWAATTGKRLVVKTDKSYDNLSAIVDKLRPEEKKRIGDQFASILRATRIAKSAGYVPESEMGSMASRSLLLDEELIDILGPQIDCEVDDRFLELLDQCLDLSIAQAYSGVVDFDDQIYMSTLFSGQYPTFPVVMVDEAQDLSPLNHATLALMLGARSRLIAVGDPHQSIYAFRGAHVGSMDVLRERYSMREMPLSVSFRCPRSVVERQQTFVPQFSYPEWAEQGKVEVLDEWDASDIPDGAAFICRNNAPLFTCAMRLLRKGRGITIVGSDIGKSLTKLMTSMGHGSLPQAAAMNAVTDWEEAEEKKAHKSRLASIRDRAECMRVFISFSQTLGEAIAYCQNLFAASGPIQLLSGHKSKGMEYDVVYHLDPHLIPSHHARKLAEQGDDSQLQQERNLRYVIETRAKKELYIVRLEDMR